MGHRLSYVGLSLVLSATGGIACGSDSSPRGSGFGATGGGGAAAGGGGIAGGGAIGGLGGGGMGGTGGGNVDPTTCEEAAASRSYIGCEFWPTVTNNGVWSIFDFAVIVANASSQVVDVTIDRGGTPVDSGSVQPNSLQKFYLPWVPELKGPDADVCGSTTVESTGVRVPNGAYHLTATAPVTVYQFNALEYAPRGGPPGKDWSACPGNQICPNTGFPAMCFSYSNDASLLLPATAFTTNYRVSTARNEGTGAFIAITGTADGTNVTIRTGAETDVSIPGLRNLGPNQVQDIPINRGEVVQLMSAAFTGVRPGPDVSGTLITSTAPVQVIAGNRCIELPNGSPACDHIEESVFPAETLGTRYFVTQPTGVDGNLFGHIVRIFGNFDNTVLSYPSGGPPNAPTTINAGQVVDLGVLTGDFEIVGDQAFAVGSFMLGGTIQDPLGTGRGDPAQSNMTAVDQFRTKYVFLAPDDYDQSWVDVTQPMTAQVIIDGVAAPPPTPIGSSSFGVARVPLGTTTGGAHVLTSTEPVGIQVIGYGSFTSYQYPGGSDLNTIAPPPVR